MSQPDLLAKAAVDGDEHSLEELLRLVQASIYRLALKMLWHPEDAKDATQEILIRIATRLSTFRGDSKFSTWAYRVAANYLLTTRKRRAENETLSFEDFAEDLLQGLESPPEDGPEQKVSQAMLAQEVRVGCTQAMLLCLDRPHRLAYVLGEILELTSTQAAQVMEVTPACFRQRLSRARKKIQDFMLSSCGLANSKAACRCRKRIVAASNMGRIDAGNLLFRVDRVLDENDIRRRISGLNKVKSLALIYQADEAMGPDLVEKLMPLISAS